MSSSPISLNTYPNIQNNYNQYNSSVESLLNSPNWSNEQDIVKISIKSLYDEITNLNNKINNIENQLENKITKTEFQNKLSSKVDMNEYVKTINDMTKNIQNHPSMEHIKFIEEDKISKNEFNNIIKDYALNNDIKPIIDNSKSINEISSNLNYQIDNLVRDLNKKLNTFPTMSDIKKINHILTTKVNSSDINNLLSLKADKEEIINILRTKCDKIDFDNQIKKKLDISEYNELINILNSKVNHEEIEELNLIIGNKMDKNSLNSIIDLINNKLDINEFNSFIQNEYKNYIEENNKKVNDIDEDFDRLISNIKTQFNNINLVITKIENDKIGFLIYDELIKKLQEKIDKKEILGTINQIQLDINEKINEIKNNNDKIKSIYEDILKTKIDEIESELNKKIEIGIFDVKQLNNNNNDINLNIEEQNKILNNIESKISIIQNENETKFCNIYGILKTKLNIHEFTEIINSLEENYNAKLLNGLENKATFKDIEMLYKNLQKDTNDKLKAIQNNTKKI